MSNPIPGSRQSYLDLIRHYARCDQFLLIALSRNDTERVSYYQRELLAICRLLSDCPEWQAVAEAESVVAAAGSY